MAKETYRYCLWHDISQDWPLKIEKLQDEDDYCHGTVFFDNGLLLKRLEMAEKIFEDECSAIEKAARDKAE